MRMTTLCRSLLLVFISGLFACGTGSSDISGGLLGAPGSNSTVRLTLTGPSDASPNIEAKSFLAILKQGDGTTAIPAQTLTFKSDKPGGIFKVNDAAATSGSTNGRGELLFSYTPSKAIAEDTPVVLTVTSEYADADGVMIARTITLNVRADVFRFSAPDFGTSAALGVDNAEPLHFQWANAEEAGGAFVAGCLKLTLDASKDKAYLFTDNDPNTRKQSFQLSTSSGDGDFTRPVSVYSESADPVEITATDCSIASHTAKVSIEFVDEPCTAVGCVNLSTASGTVAQSPDTNMTQRRVLLTSTVFNADNEPAEGVKLSFKILTAVGSGPSYREKVSPPGGTTNSEGVASTEYFVPDNTGTAKIQACAARASGDPVCETVNILVN